MPQLKSGRHVALSVSPYLDAINSGSEEQRFFAIVAVLMNAGTPEALRNHVVIGYFIESEGTPPDAPCHISGYCVGDVLEGRSDWAPDEVDELTALLDEPRFHQWLGAQFDVIDHAIKGSPVRAMEIMKQDLASKEISAPKLKRAVIIKTALDPHSMAQLRSAAYGSRSVLGHSQ